MTVTANVDCSARELQGFVMDQSLQRELFFEPTNVDNKKSKFSFV